MPLESKPCKTGKKEMTSKVLVEEEVELVGLVQVEWEEEAQVVQVAQVVQAAQVQVEWEEEDQVALEDLEVQIIWEEVVQWEDQVALAAQVDQAWVEVAQDQQVQVDIQEWEEVALEDLVDQEAQEWEEVALEDLVPLEETYLEIQTHLVVSESNKCIWEICTLIS